MMVPTPGTRWDLDATSFHDAARRDWPEAGLSEPVAMGNGNTEVMINTTPPGEGRALSASLSVQPDKDGSFSIRSGTSPEAAEMFAWFRDWLGPQQTASILNSSRGLPLIEIPSGATARDILQVVQSLIS